MSLRVSEVEKDGGDSSRESGIDEARGNDHVPEEVEGLDREDGKEDYEGNRSLGSAEGNKDDGGSISVALGRQADFGYEDDAEHKDDVKRLTGFDTASSQQRRRKEALEWQRQRRDEILDKIRQLEDSAFSDSETEDEMDFAESVRQTASAHKQQTLEEIFEEEGAFTVDQVEATAVSTQKPKSGRRKRNRHSKGGAGSNSESMEVSQITVYPQFQGTYSHQPVYTRRPRYRGGPCKPMLSEWLLEKPEDFDEMWLGVLCPAGKRVIVMASRGKTKIFSRTDEYLGSYKSLLPGGCKYNYRDSTTNRNRGVTILDCIWSEQTQTFYVLDIICWNSHSCVNCDTDYRQFFLTSKFSENLELLERSRANPFPFKPLPCFPASELPLVLWSTLAFSEEIDGIVFFHKEAFYISDVNPLCLWILLTQVEPILKVSVSPELLSRQKKVKNSSSRKRQQQMKKQRGDKQNSDMEVAQVC